MNSKNIYDTLDDNSTVPDPNEILDLKLLNPVWKIIKSSSENIYSSSLDDEDLSNLLNWLNNYKIIYSYREWENNL